MDKRIRSLGTAIATPLDYRLAVDHSNLSEAEYRTLQQIIDLVNVEGAQLLSGSTTPDNAIGNNGDFYNKITSNSINFYQKVADVWTNIGGFSFTPLPNRVVSGLTYTVSTDDVEISAGSWIINEVSYNKASITQFLNIALSASGLQRYIRFYATTSNTILKIEGSESSIALVPDIPANTLGLYTILVNDAGIGDVVPDLSGYQLKSEKSNDILADKLSTEKYPSVRAVFDGTIPNYGLIENPDTIINSSHWFMSADNVANPFFGSGSSGFTSSGDTIDGEYCWQLLGADDAPSRFKVRTQTAGAWSAWQDFGKGDVTQDELNDKVTGPASSTDNAIARFDGTTGKLIQNSGAAIDDSGNITATNLSGTNTGNETTTTVGTLINGATSKTSPVDADQLALMDSAASNIVKKLSFANLKATLKTYFDTLYAAAIYTFSTGLTNNSGTVTNNLSTGVSGGQSVVGSTSTNSGLTLKATTGVGATGADIDFKVGNNGNKRAATIKNDMSFVIGSSNPSALVDRSLTIIGDKGTSSLPTTAGMAELKLISFNNGDQPYHSNIKLSTNGGTEASQSMPLSGQILGTIYFGAEEPNADHHYSGAVIQAFAVENWQYGVQRGTKLVLSSTPPGTWGGGTELLTIGSNANVGIGYGATEGSYKLDVNGDINTTGAFRKSGTLIKDIAETLTNKRVTPRLFSNGSAATITIDINSYDQYNVTGLSEAMTINAPSGTPTDGQALMLRIKDNGTTRALTWNAIFRASTDFALPTSTTATKTMYLQFIYNAADTKWDAVGYTKGF